MKNLPMTLWAAEELPSYKIERNGVESLTNAELLSLIIGFGSRDCDAVTMSRQILDVAGGSLLTLARKSVKELTQIKGISKAKAMKIVSAMELARRKEQEYVIKKHISTTRDAVEIFRSKQRDLEHEEAWCIFLNNGNYLLCCKKMSSGGTTHTVVDPAVILKEALLLNATGVILSHNHPSTSIKPSRADNNITHTLVSASAALQIRFCDHIIIGGNDYYSYAEEGTLY